MENGTQQVLIETMLVLSGLYWIIEGQEHEIPLMWGLTHRPIH